MPDALMHQQAFCQAHHERYGEQDSVKEGADMFCNLLAQICWLADRLSEARILVNNDSCASCRRMSFANCARCWRDEAAKAAREGRHSR